MSESVFELNADAFDALTEMVNIGVGRAAAALSDLIGERIELCVPRVRLCHNGACMGRAVPESASTTTVVMQDFSGRISGRAALAFPQASAQALGSLLSGDEMVSTEIDAELNGILLEVGNIVLNSALGSLSNLSEDNFDYSLPTLFDDHPTLSRLLLSQEEKPDMLFADVEFHVKQREIVGTIAIVFCGDCVEYLLQQMLQPAAA